MLGTKDPLSFQQVQAMSSVSEPPVTQAVDNSDHGEMLQWIDENGNTLTPMEKELYSGLNTF